MLPIHEGLALPSQAPPYQDGNGSSVPINFFHFLLHIHTVFTMTDQAAGQAIIIHTFQALSSACIFVALS